MKRSADYVVKGKDCSHNRRHPGHWVRNREEISGNGAKVVLFGSREETVAKALASLRAENPEWEVSGAWPNLVDADEVAAEISKIRETYGRIDILINNAGISDSTPISGYTAERFAKIMQLNVDAVMNGVLAVVDIMKEQGGGCILNTSSMVSFCGSRRRWVSHKQIRRERAYLVVGKRIGPEQHPGECRRARNHKNGYGRRASGKDDPAAH